MTKRERMKKLMEYLQEKCNESIIRFYAKKNKMSFKLKFKTPSPIKKVKNAFESWTYKKQRTNRISKKNSISVSMWTQDQHPNISKKMSSHPFTYIN